jgi:Tfp pilus assembly protein PilF
LNKSVAYYRQAISIDPKDLWAIKGAVGSALEAGNLVVSREVLDEAINHMPDEPEIYELVARVAQTAGETKLALDAISYARSLRKD